MDFVAFLIVASFGAATVSASGEWLPRIVEGPRTLVSQDMNVAEGISKIQAANNNVGAVLFNNHLFMAWRSAPTHFASSM